MKMYLNGCLGDRKADLSPPEGSCHSVKTRVATLRRTCVLNPRIQKGKKLNIG
jgi:hypothetical protein